MDGELVGFSEERGQSGFRAGETKGIQGMKLSDETLLALEMDALLRLIAELTNSDLGGARALDLAPVRRPEELGFRRQRFLEVGTLIRPPLVPGFEADLAPLVARTAESLFAPDGLELLAIADLLEVLEEARSRITAAWQDTDEHPLPSLAESFSVLGDGTGLSRAIRTSLDGRGEIRDDASPKLTRLRATIRRRRDRLYGELGALTQKHRELFSEDTVPLRDGRLMLMLQAGSKGRLPGLVHGRSATGKSFYFEPLTAVEGNNELNEALEEEGEEKRRILLELQEAVRAQAGKIREFAALLGELDLWQAVNFYAQYAEASLVAVGASQEVDLRAARHPLLDPRLSGIRERALGQAGHRRPIVPLDLQLTPKTRALVITGPNAGGKTVALKTLGLACLAHSCGLPVPADEESVLPVLSDLVATIGDDQDLLADRSTFSGRLIRLREVWNVAGEGGLVLLDELGAGTDPEEGAALSSALLDALIDRGCLVVVTTHLGQLAALALERDGASCAAMEFDSDRGQPRFRLVPGPPGGSEALALARRVGLPDELVSAAEARLGTEGRDYRRMLGEVSDLRDRLVTEERELAGARNEAEALRRGLERDRESLELEKARVGERARQELELFRREVRANMEGAVEQLKAQWEAGRRRGLPREATEALLQEPPGVAKSPEPPTTTAIEVGTRVRHSSLGWEGVLQKLERGRAEVGLKGKTFRCRASELQPAASSTSATERSSSKHKPLAELPTQRSVPLELVLIGKRVEPALDSLADYLDGAIREGRTEVRVVHGHGTGRLRRAVRDYLKGHPGIARQRPGGTGEGGDGATVVELQK